MLAVYGDYFGSESLCWCIGALQEDVGFAAIAEGMQDMSGGKQIAFTIDEERVAVEGVAITTRGRRIIHGIDDRANGARNWDIVGAARILRQS